MDDKQDVMPEEQHNLMGDEAESVHQQAPEGEAPVDNGEILKKIEALRTRLDVAEKQAKEYEDKALRAMAELENTKRRAQIDVEHAHKFSLEKCLNQLIPVIDSLDQGIDAAGDAPETAAIREGMEMTLKQFVDTMTKFGVERLDPVGEAFDPSVHEAMTAQESPDHQADTVITVFQRGYRLNGRLVRPARVIVAK